MQHPTYTALTSITLHSDTTGSAWWITWHNPTSVLPNNQSTARYPTAAQAWAAAQGHVLAILQAGHTRASR